MSIAAASQDYASATGALCRSGQRLLGIGTHCAPAFNPKCIVSIAVRQL